MNDLDVFLAHIESSEWDTEALLKDSPSEKTWLVRGIGPTNTGLKGIRKSIVRTSGLGSAYRELYEASIENVVLKHVPRVYDYHETEQELSVVLEYIEGDPLTVVIQQLPSEERLSFTLGIMSSLCDAVCELHERFDPPLIHRDIKPSNIIVDPVGHDVSLIDLGISRQLNAQADRDTHLYGTLTYAPPEQFGYSATDVRSDMYALGLVFAFCLTGEEPTAELRINGFAHPAIPPALALVLKHACAFDPANRYQSVREMKQALFASLTEALRHTDQDTSDAATKECAGSITVHTIDASASQQHVARQPAYTLTASTPAAKPPVTASKHGKSNQKKPRSWIWWKQRIIQINAWFWTVTFILAAISYNLQSQPVTLQRRFYGTWAIPMALLLIYQRLTPNVLTWCIQKAPLLAKPLGTIKAAKERFNIPWWVTVIAACLYFYSASTMPS